MTRDLWNLKIGTFKLTRAYISYGYNHSWMAHIQLGPGAGYRWIDLPGHSNSIHHPFRSRYLTILGRTWSFGRNVKQGTYKGGRQIKPFFTTLGFSTRANLNTFPQW